MGAASTPVFFSTQAATTGIYFTSTPAMVFAANGTAIASITGTSMNVAQQLNAQAALAVTGTSTFAAGVTAQSTLAVTGASTFAAGVSVTGTVNATNLTVTSGGGGKITFADGTTQTTAAVSSGAGSSAQFVATSNGTVSAPAFTFTNQSDSGMYLAGASTTNASIGWSVNGAQQMLLSKQVLTTPSSITCNFNGPVATGALTAGSTVTTGGYVRPYRGSATNPAYQDSYALNTGRSIRAMAQTVSITFRLTAYRLQAQRQAALRALGSFLQPTILHLQTAQQAIRTLPTLPELADSMSQRPARRRSRRASPLALRSSF